MADANALRFEKYILELRDYNKQKYESVLRAIFNISFYRNNIFFLISDINKCNTGKIMYVQMF